MGGKRETATAQKQTVYKPTPVQLTYGVVEANKFNMKSPPNGLQLDHCDQSLQGTYHWEECSTVKQQAAQNILKKCN
ncbi:hypothetical protein DPMN_173605 [Dreissena polymorpha]|uniref:Uncharacterized protein n=1 Tax=Dreissena polymorpha TaxID=45954 RepID=A0A9D4IH35_DREPO|nr:hypothetical protein DPMN_173605 [Dreissena polymorpha]